MSNKLSGPAVKRDKWQEKYNILLHIYVYCIYNYRNEISGKGVFDEIQNF